MSIFLPNLYKRNDAFYILWLIIDLMLDLRVSQCPVLAKRLQRSWADIQYLTHVLVLALASEQVRAVKPLTKPFVCSSTSHFLHL